MAPLPDYPEALAALCNGPWHPTSTERICLDQASDRILAGTITADRDLPPFDRAAMDGYALRTADLDAGTPLPSVGFIAAGDPSMPDVPEGSCIGIATGAPVPASLDAVVPHEWTDRGDPVTFHEHPVPGQSIHRRGSDAAEGAELVHEGTRLGAAEIGLAAAVGQSTVVVRTQPTVTILSSGDEIIPIEVLPEPHQVRNSNLPMVTDLLARMGARVVESALLPDDPDHTRDVLQNATSDVIVTIGGISAGARDAFRDAIDAMDASIVLRGAAIQPGRPIQVASIGAVGEERPILSLPGNPVSALCTACLFAWPLFLMLQGAPPQLPWTRGVLGSDAARNARRRRFRPVTRDSEGHLHVPTWQGSGDLAHAAGTIGLVDLAAGADAITAGTEVTWMPWP
ncbi:MAG: molybdopterin molybdotransferase MoeA [Phycisphaerales bacterium]|nr:molybdopterin molybdotransferase MoeA [Phycisphaerales bacterium]